MLSLLSLSSLFYHCGYVHLMLHFYLILFQRGTPTQEAVDSQNNHPHIVRFLDASGDIPPSHFIAVEQDLLLECRNMRSSVFMMLAAYYIFNIEYCSEVKDVLYYIQDRVLGVPDPSKKQSSVYRNVSAAIDLYLSTP